MPASIDESPTDTSAVELIGPDSWLSTVRATEEPVQRSPSPLPTALIVAAFGVIAVAFALMSRPGGQSEAEPDQAAPVTAPTPAENVTDPDPDAASDRAADRLALRAIPAFDDNVPGELPGVLSGIDERGSLIVIDRAEPKPVETALGALVVAGEADAPTSIGLLGAGMVHLDAEVVKRGTSLSVDSGGVRRVMEVAELVPGREGTLLLVQRDRLGGVVATAVPLDESGDEQVWTLPGRSVEVLGQWGGSLLIRQANQVWLYDEGGAASWVTSERVLAFDGRHLVVLRCGAPATCELTIGTPDEPGQRTVALPASLASLAPEAWVESVAIAPDGTKLATSVDHGVLSLPMVIDMETGESRSLADGMNRKAALAWSPDSRWIAYVFTDDVMVWPIDSDRSWRVTLDRPLAALIWR